MRNFIKALLIKLARRDYQRMGAESILVCQDRITKKVRVYNVSDEAVRDFRVSRKEVSFRASFDGVIYEVSEPIDNVAKIFCSDEDVHDDAKFFEISEESGPELKVVSGLKKD